MYARHAARCIGVAKQVGTLEPGAWADFVVLDGNPLDDIRKSRGITAVWVGGEPVPGR